MKSFIFCTSCVRNNLATHYLNRYKRWINYNLALLDDLKADRLFLIDDGGNVEDDSFKIIQKKLPNQLTDKVYLYRFDNNLGRRSLHDYPGWWRSFLFAIEIAGKYGYNKIIHIESDYFVLSDKLKTFIRDVDQGWNCMYSDFFQFPEPAIQVICEDAFDNFRAVREELRENGYQATGSAEGTLPFTNVQKNFVGDRIGEIQVLAKWLDEDAGLLGKMDYVGQMNIPEYTPK